MKDLIFEYHDQEVIEWLTYGFSISRSDTEEDPWPATCNHAGAINNPDAIDAYIKKEIRLGATMGPFLIPPYINRIGISPLSTRPKRDSSAKRVILDLSFPEFHSVNSGIDKNFYCGEAIKLSYPSIDSLCQRIATLGQHCLLWKRDLQRFFRQIPLCPRDYSLISYRWRNLIYIDINVPMGLTSAAYIAQRTTCAIVYIHHSMGYWSINYLDDFGSAELRQQAWSSYNLMGRILRSLNVAEADEKAVTPTTRMEFLGNTVDTVKMTLEVSDDRKQELLDLLNNWMRRTVFSKKQLQSLIGKLSFVTNCVQAGRLFLSRLIDQISEAQESRTNIITADMRLDMQWWQEFLPSFDGSAILWLLDKWNYDQQLASDASMVGAGATFNQEYIHSKFTEEILTITGNIAQRELYTILVAMRLWGAQMTGRVVRFYTDNQVSMFAVNRGRTKDPFMLYCLREITKVTAKYEILLRCKYISTKANTLPDGLSRWYITAEARRTVKRLINKDWKRRSVNDKLTNVSNFNSQA